MECMIRLIWKMTIRNNVTGSTGWAGAAAVAFEGPSVAPNERERLLGGILPYSRGAR